MLHENKHVGFHLGIFAWGGEELDGGGGDYACRRHVALLAIQIALCIRRAVWGGGWGS